jgi:hypothetical protein
VDGEFAHDRAAPRGRRRGRILAAIAALASLSLLGAGSLLGRQMAFSTMQIDPGDHAALQEELTAAAAQLDTVQGALDLERTRHEIDRRALEMVRREIAAQKERIADLEEGLRFYKGLMAPGDKDPGLSLRPVELIAREAPGRYAFRIVVQQEASNHALVKGTLYAEVTGALGGQEVSYPLAELSEELAERSVALRFRYFQVIEGELVLPGGFEPREISLVASAGKPYNSEVRERFPWKLKEKFTYVGE